MESRLEIGTISCWSSLTVFLLVALISVSSRVQVSGFQNGCSKEEEVKVEDPQSSGLRLEAFGSLTQQL